jgi:hypothetical protein
MKYDVFRFCRCLRYVGSVMIIVVLGLEALVYHAISTTYIKILKKSGAGYKVLAVLVLLTYTALVR